MLIFSDLFKALALLIILRRHFQQAGELIFNYQMHYSNHVPVVANCEKLLNFLNRLHHVSLCQLPGVLSGVMWSAARFGLGPAAAVAEGDGRVRQGNAQT